MASSMINGERRWASARRGGMTVLGKVAVPKPINLPSQRLENHGLDPNVEIVPKGTLSWGSRPSSAGSNAWGTSALSPTTDGSSSSPSHLVGRPSSGGGTRPSTAGSERAHDSNVNVWSSNSRPSSASGVLASNSSSLTSLRPRSAETRPGSSQLSRFAEPSAESSGAWGSSATSERLGVAKSKNDGFSLSTGDFPTLGSEKDESIKNTESADGASHGRPGSSSGVTTMSDSMRINHGDDGSRNADFKGNSWRKDGPPYVDDGPRPSMERWHGEPHPYQNPNMAPHYESWRGAPPVNAPGGVWYRGPPGPPPYGAPGGFPMEPYPYYRPQVPAPGLANSQPMPPPGAGPHGHHPKNGDMYRPHMPDSYMRPGMPIRPGYYPGPVPYEGYYGPPMGFCNPNERDLPFMGMAAGPPVFSRPVNPNAPDPNNSHPRSGEGRGPEQVEHNHLHDPRGNFKVLTKQKDGWKQNDEEKWGHRGTSGAPNREKGILSKASIRDNAWGDGGNKDEDVHYGRSLPVEEAASQSSKNNFGSTSRGNLEISGNASNVEDTEMSAGIEKVASPRDLSLMQKIEGLNAKARASGGRQDGFHREELHDRVQIVNAKANRSANDANYDVALERHYPSGVLVPVSRDFNIATVDNSNESSVPIVTPAPRRPARGAQGRGDHHGKGFNGQDVDGWRKKSESNNVSAAGSGSGSNVHEQVDVQHAARHPAEMPKQNVERKGDGESVITTFDPSDTQRAKMREIAKQRAIQLQKEEEERIREQKAKALAKLEELNRRSANQGTENPGHVLESVPPPTVAPHKQEDPRNQREPSLDVDQSFGSSSFSTNNNITQTSEGSASNAVGAAVPSMQVGAETKKTAYRDSVLSQNQLPAADVNLDDAAGHKTVPQVREVHKQKRPGNKPRQNIPPEKNLTEDFIPASRRDVVNDQNDTGATDNVSGSEVITGAGRELAESPLVSDPPVHQKKKNNKSGKRKHKVEESSAAVSLPVPKDSSLAQAVHESAEQNASDLKINSTSMQSSADAKDATHSSENHPSLSREDAHGRVNNSWKPQHSRKPRTSQGNKLSEKTHSSDGVVWAPVRSHNKVEASDQTIQKAAEPSPPPGTGDIVINSSSKAKRAEMERYVPKPVAKELAQQSSFQQSPSPSVDQIATDETGGRVKTSQGSDYVAKAGSVVDSKQVDGKQRQKPQGSWRQRVSAESIPVQASQDSSAAADNGKNVQTSNESQHTVRSDESLVGRPRSRPDEPLAKGSQANLSDGWNSVNDTGPAVADHVPSGRGKRHPFKGHKGSGNSQNFTHKDSNAGLTDLQCSPVETNQTERAVPSKENKVVGDRSMSHWQPKSQGYVAHNQHGNRSRGGQKFIAEDSKALKRETGHNGDPHLSSQHNLSASRDPIPAGEDKDVGGGMPSLGPQEHRRDKKAASVKGPHSPSHGPVGEVEPAPFGAADGRNEQRPSSGYRKNANYGGRFSRGHESRGDWSSTAQENKQQHYASANRESQRQNSHYEYQPVGPYKSNSRSNDSGSHPENQPGGPRFRERGQNHSRRGRGNFYGRQSGNPADGGYE